MTDQQRYEAMRYIADQASQAAAAAHYATKAMQSLISNDPVPSGAVRQGPAGIFRWFRERHKPLKESSFYVRPDGTIGCHRDNHHTAKEERQAMREKKEEESHNE